MRSKKYVEMAIIGGGIGGIAAGLWASRLEITSRIFEGSEHLGGQLHWISKEIPDYPGVVGKDGAAFAASLQEQVKMLRLSADLKSSVCAIDPVGGKIQTPTETWEASSIVIATGLRRRRLALPEAEAWEGRGLFYTAHGQRGALEGKRVAIVGGGDGAFENALALAEIAPHVDLVFRGSESRARRDFVEAAHKHPRITLHPGSSIQALQGGEALTSVVIADPKGEKRLPVEALLVKIGFQPQSDLLFGLCDLDSEGYVCVSPLQKTSAPRLWAVGDICTPQDPSLSASVGQASIAARDIKRFLRTPQRISQGEPP